MSHDKLNSFDRWKATVTYRTEAGTVDVPSFLPEIQNLHHRIECVPHWDTIVRIEIERVNHIDSPTLTIEQALKM